MLHCQSVSFLGVHAFKLNSAPIDYRDKTSKVFDPIRPVAEEIADETWLLCFDQFQVIVSFPKATLQDGHQTLPSAFSSKFTEESLQCFYHVSRKELARLMGFGMKSTRPKLSAATILKAQHCS